MNKLGYSWSVLPALLLVLLLELFPQLCLMGCIDGALVRAYDIHGYIRTSIVF